MSMPYPISQYLRQADIDFNILKHKPMLEITDAARAAAIPMQQLVRSTVVKAAWIDTQRLMVLYPADQQLDLDKLATRLGGNYQAASRQELEQLFSDCDSGVIPAMGQPFELMMLIDQQLFEQPQLYLEDGDNTELIKLEQQQFAQLMNQALRGDLCRAH